MTVLAAVVLSGPALASAQPFTVVSTPASDALVLLDLSSHTVVAPLPVNGLPTGCAMSRSGRRVYAALTQANALAIVNVGTGAVRTVAVGASPAAVAVSAGRVYVANTGTDTVSVVAAGSGAVLATIPVGRAPIALAIAGSRLYVANWGAATVSVVDTATNTALATIPVGALPAGLAVHGATHRLYVANFVDDTVSVIDTDALSVLSTIPVVRRPRGLAVDGSGQRLFVAGFDDALVQAIDTATGTVTREGPSGGANPVDLMLGPGGARLYVAHLQETQGIAVLDAATLAPVTSVSVPAGPVAFAGLAPRTPRPRSPSRAQYALRAVSTARRAIAALFVRGSPASSTSLNDPVVISDGEFRTADWSVSGMAEWDVQQQLSGGNPGAWRRTTHFVLSSDSKTVHRFVRPGSTYTPATQGAIGAIDLSYDRSILAGSIAYDGVVLEQDGVVYETFEHASDGSGWTTFSRINLGADSFSDQLGRHPDFSAAGSTLRFGYFLHTSSVATVVFGIDNFTVSVRPHVDGNSTLGFQRTFDEVTDGDAPFVYVQRRNGVQGLVSVEVLIQPPDREAYQHTLSWPDGDDQDGVVLALFLQLPEGSGARTTRLTLRNPTGGASIDPARAEMVIAVIPAQWPAQLTALFLRLAPLLGGFPGAWVLVMAVPAVALAARRVWSRGVGLGPFRP
jgi:YVTN family beta-propeller protein